MSQVEKVSDIITLKLDDVCNKLVEEIRAKNEPEKETQEPSFDLNP